MRTLYTFGLPAALVALAICGAAQQAAQPTTLEQLSAQVQQGKTSLPALLERFKQMIEREPRNPAGYVLAAAVYDRAESRGLYQKAIAIAPDYADAYVGLGRHHLRQIEMAPAFTALSKAVALKPNDEQLRIETIRAATRSSKLAEAEKLAGDNASRQLEIARALLDDNKFDAALKYVRAIRGASQGEVLAIEARADYLRGAKDSGAQARAFDKWLEAWKLAPGDIGFYRWMYPRDSLVTLLSRTRRYRDAESVALKGLELYPEEYALYEHVWKAWFGEAKTDYSAERERLTLAVGKLLERKVPPELLKMATLGYDMASRPADADRVRKRTLAEFPFSSAAQSLRRMEASKEPDLRRKIALMEAYNRDFFSMPMYGDYFAAVDQLNPPKEELLKAAELYVAKVEYPYLAVYEIGPVFLRRGIYLDRLGEWLDRVVRPETRGAVKPDAWTARLLAIKGKMLVLQNKSAAAEPMLRPLTDLQVQGYSNVDRGRARWHLADCLLALGNKEQAMEMYAQAFAQSQHYFIEPGNEFRRLYRELKGGEAGLDDYLGARETMFQISENTGIERGTQLNVPAPDFNLLSLKGDRVSLASLKGKVVVVNFWATWCGPCIKELPHFDEVYQKLKSDGNVAVLAITTDENRGLVEPFVTKNGYSFPVLFDEGVRAKFGVRGIPATFIIDPNGMMRLRMIGFNQNEPLLPYLLKLIDQYRTKR